MCIKVFDFQFIFILLQCVTFEDNHRDQSSLSSIVIENADFLTESNSVSI